MKKDFVKRALCLVCCLTLTLGAFAYRPPEAKAVFASPAVALGASLLASVVVGTTATFFVSSGAADTIGMAIDGLVREFVSTTADLAEYTSDMFLEEIPNGLVILQDGTIQLSAAAGHLTARFVNWLQCEKGLSAAGPAVSVHSEEGMVLSDGSIFPVVYYSGVSNGASFPNNGSPILRKGIVYTFRNGFSFYAEGSIFYYKGSSSSSYTASSSLSYFSSDYYTLLGRIDLSKNYAIASVEGGVLTVARHNFGTWSQFGDKVSLDVDLQPNVEFKTVPNDIPTNSYLSINLGLQSLDLADPQATADYIMDAIYAGTLNPSIAVEQEAADIPGTDTDEDDIITVPGTDADLLDWTKYIGQKVASIPQAIGQSVAQSVSAAFAPDPNLVNEITGAFSAKFGFVETLKQVGDDLFGMDASSEPPVVWIHLEDAEGRYNYGGTVKALDMSWYQRYKEDMDRILSGFLWIAYLWLLFRRLPDIISGTGMVIAESHYLGEGMYVDDSTGEVLGSFKFRRSKRL